ncbi:MAG: TolC family protein, partial [Acidobacteriota bacterium]
MKSWRDVMVAVGAVLVVGAGGRPARGGDVLHLTLSEAIRRGLEHNLAAVLAEQSVQEASGGRAVAASGLLPHLSAGVSQAREKINLEAYGLPVAPGESPLIGPFSVFDARVSVSQSLVDLASAGRSRAGRERLAAARLSAQDVRDTVVAECAGLYLEVVTGESRVAAATAQARTAKALYDRAVDLRAQGMVPGIDVLRAQVQLEGEQQKVIVEENRTAKLKLALARAIGVPLGDAIELVDRVPFTPVHPESVDDALRKALAHRADYRAAQATLTAAEAERDAVRGEDLPSLVAVGDVGTIGSTPRGAKETYSLAAALRIPIFAGGAVRGKALIAAARVKEEQARLEDLRARIEFEVRAAYLDLQAAADRVKVGESAVSLAARQLEQAQDRYSAGVANSIEVVQA